MKYEVGNYVFIEYYDNNNYNHCIIGKIIYQFNYDENVFNIYTYFSSGCLNIKYGTHVFINANSNKYKAIHAEKELSNLPIDTGFINKIITFQ